MIRVLLADDNAFVRRALVDLFSTSVDIRVVAACADGEQVATAADETRPDVALLDLAMPKVGGLEAARKLLAFQPDVRVVFLTATASAAAIREAREMGAFGYLLKDVDPDELCRQLRRVAAGNTAWGVEADLHGLTETPVSDTLSNGATRAPRRDRGL